MIFTNNEVRFKEKTVVSYIQVFFENFFE